MISTSPYLPLELWFEIFSYLDDNAKLLWRPLSVSRSFCQTVEAYFRSQWIPKRVKLLEQPGWMGDFSHFSADGTTVYFYLASTNMEMILSRHPKHNIISRKLLISINRKSQDSPQAWDISKVGFATPFYWRIDLEENGSTVGVDWRKLMEKWARAVQVFDYQLSDSRRTLRTG
jgi:hypothetical protein